MSLYPLIARRIHDRGPLTVAEYMDLALYHPEHGYYSRAAQRSGRDGDFYTSVDVGPLFGEMLAVQFAEMWSGLRETAAGATDAGPRGAGPFMLVEAAAGNGRLARDVLDAAAAAAPGFYADVRLSLVERSAAARAAQPATLGPHAAKLASSGPDLPPAVDGVIFANELLDALPAHQVVMTAGGLREVFVDLQDGRLVPRIGPLSSARLAEYLDGAGARLAPGWRAEVPLAAEAWTRDAARRLRRGFLIIIDYGHEAAELYSAAHAAGTLRSFRAHALDRVSGAGPAGPAHEADPRVSHAGRATTPERPAWLDEPGERDITLQVDFTALVRAAEGEGLTKIGLLDQTYFLLGLGIAERAADVAGDGVPGLKRRLAIKTLTLPGGLGSTHKVLVMGRGVGIPRLRGLTYRHRMT